MKSPPVSDHPPEEGSSAARGRWGRWLSIFALGALVLGPIFYLQGSNEVARWHLAAATEHYLNGHIDQALAQMDAALRWNPDGLEILLTRADWHRDAKDFAASLKDCDRVIELTPELTNGYLVRSLAYQRMGRHEEAIEDWNEIVRLSERIPLMPMDNALNGRAYARAIGSIDIDKGLVDAEASIAMLESHQYGRPGDNHDRLYAAVLDTRGYLYYLNGDMDSALTDLSRSITIAERLFKGSMTHHEKTEFDDRRIAVARRNGEHGLAVMYHHRGLVYQALSNEHRAAADLRQAVTLGYNPAEGVW